MFTLVTDKSNFYKIKCNQSATQIQKELKIPFYGEVYNGKIICLDKREFEEYEVLVGETYYTLSKKFGVEKDDLKKINSNKPVYPTCKIFVPK